LAFKNLIKPIEIVTFLPDERFSPSVNLPFTLIVILKIHGFLFSQNLVTLLFDLHKKRAIEMEGFSLPSVSTGEKLLCFN